MKKLVKDIGIFSISTFLILLYKYTLFFALNEEIGREKALNEANIAFVTMEICRHLFTTHCIAQKWGINLKEQHYNQMKG